MLIDVQKGSIINIGDLLVETDSSGYQYFYLVARIETSEKVCLIMLNSRGREVPVVYEIYSCIDSLNEMCGLEKISEYKRLALVDIESLERGEINESQSNSSIFQEF